MDYVGRQFVVLIDKFRKELRKCQETLHVDLMQLSDRVKDFKESLDKQIKSEEEHHDTPITTISELRTQVPIGVQDKTKKSKPEWAWAITKGIIEIAVGIAVVVYTIVTYGAWQEQIDATNFAGRQTELSRKALNETVKNFRMDQRPYVFAQPIASGENEKGERVIFEPVGQRSARINISVQITNGGKSPAMFLASTHSEIMIGPKDEVRKKARDFVEKYSGGSILLAPGVTNVVPHGEFTVLTSSEAVEIREGSWEVYIVGAVKYSDLIGSNNPKTLPYKTRYCFQFIPSGLSMGNCGFGTLVK
jgi:hypothetical protein